MDGNLFGRNLKEWRLYRGMTLQDLELKTGLKKHYLTRIEQGLNKGTPNQWIRLLKALNVSLGEEQLPRRKSQS
ncbi:helix-turn-helix domain-containing protein [Desulfosporosinus sp. SYSU MS00001]|uniref:helix-turn-helix domain-containing protein n=1 Tax=Desulfosporosinus sp. SYSU MS00001 TaxID=3416284 RepID=UPI003CE8F565